VWQHTGEDWLQADLRFSTERPSQQNAPPKLSTQVDVPRKPPPLDRGPSIRRTLVPDVLPAVDDRGETFRLRGSHPATIRSDGTAQRVPIFEFESAADISLTLTRGDLPTAFLRTAQANASDYPLLAGPVELIRDKGNCGRTVLGYVAPGALFHLDWGADPDLRIRAAGDAVHISNVGPQTKHLEIQEGLPALSIPPYARETVRGGD
jgi:hypothetical protein